MCRLYGFRANELTRVDCNLVRSQNTLLATAEEGDNLINGWGIVCYGDCGGSPAHMPDLVRHKTAGHHQAEFSRFAESMYAETVVAHVRVGSLGYVGSLNSHPFTHESWTFAHLGQVSGFAQLSSQLAAETGRLQDCRLGDTDSEQLFLWLLRRMQLDGVNLETPALENIVTSLSISVPEFDLRCKSVQPEVPPQLTFILTNGPLMIGCRWGVPLYSLCQTGDQACNICGAFHAKGESDAKYRAVKLASEPLTDQPWHEVTEQSLFTIDEKIETATCSTSAGQTC